MENIEIYYDQIKKRGNSFVIVVPPKVMRFGGYQDGDLVKIMMRKRREDD